MRQQLYLEERYAYKLPDGQSLFWLEDPIALPNQEYRFTVSVPNASFPLTHFAITEKNRTLELLVVGVSTKILLPIGNHSIDEVVEHINSEAAGTGVEVSYRQNTNKVSFSSPASLSIGAATTAQTLLGVRAGGTAANGVYEAPDGVNLAGPSHFFVRSNLRTRNRDPVALGFSSVLAKVPIERSFNGIQKFEAPFYKFAISERSVHYIVVSVLDDSLEPVEFHGGHWSLTLEFDVEKAESYLTPTDYRLDLLTTQQNGPLGGSANPSADQRPVENPGRQQRASS